MRNEGDAGAEDPRVESQPEVELFPALDAEPIGPIIEYVARRLGQNAGHRQMVFWLFDGRLEHSELAHRRLTRQGLELVATALRAAT